LESGNTIILVTHEEEVAHYSHRIIRLRDGLVESDNQNGNPVVPKVSEIAEIE
jgi:putative ABC transport system ATP-binding protein